MLWPEIITVFLLSALKMMVGLLTALAAFKFDAHLSFIVCSLGGVTGCLIFIFLSTQIWKLIDTYFSGRIKERKVKKIFTPQKRRYIFYKNKFGLPGLALLTPTILSIPLGCFLASKFFKNKTKVVIWMCSSTILWAWLVSYLYEYFI